MELRSNYEDVVESNGMFSSQTFMKKPIVFKRYLTETQDNIDQWSGIYKTGCGYITWTEVALNKGFYDVFCYFTSYGVPLNHEIKTSYFSFFKMLDGLARLT
jgi:hypothetical protein